MSGDAPTASAISSGRRYVSDADKLEAGQLVAKLAVGVATAAILVRLFVFLCRPSLWNDELFLSLGLVSRNFLELLQPLPFGQCAPVLFLWAEHAMVWLAGGHDWALRLVPLLASAALLPLAWNFFRKLLAPWPALFALGLLAASPGLLRYSIEVKPYELDPPVAVALILCALPLIQGRESTAGWLRLITFGLIALGFSMPALFVLGGIWAALLFRPGVTTRRAIVWRAAALLVWATTFIAIYQVFYARAASDSFMRAYWEGAFLLSQPGLKGKLWYIAQGLTHPLFGLEAYLPRALVLTALPLAALGLYKLVRRHGSRTGLLFFTPLASAMAASALEKWALVSRFMIWTAPLTALLVAAGLWHLLFVFSSRARVQAFAVGSMAILFLPAKGSLWFARHPEWESQRQAVQQVQNAFRPGSVVYVYSKALPGWLFYTTDWRSPDTARVERLMAVMAAIGPNSGNGPSRGRAVNGEGFDYRFTWRDGVQLAGIADGIFNRYVPIPTSVDLGWAENEVRRMRTAAPSSPVWILTSGQNDSSRVALLASVRNTGAHLEEVWSGSQLWSVKAYVFRVRFPAEQGTLQVTNPEQ